MTTLVVGWDGVPLSLLDRLAPVMPHTRALFQEASVGQLASVPNLNSAPAWTSMVTGADPGEHGIFFFTHDDWATGGRSLVDRRNRAVPALWERATGAGATVTVLGVPVSHPVDQVRGGMLAGWDSPRQGPAYQHPSDLLAWLADQGCDYPLTSSLASQVRAGKVAEGMAAVGRSIRSRSEAARLLLERFQPDLLFVVFEDPDTAHHLFWGDMVAGGPYGSAIEQVYCWLDVALGELLDAVGPSSPVLLVSDHGAGPDPGRAAILPALLRRAGLMTQGQSGTAKAVGHVYRSLDRHLPMSVKRDLASALPQLKQRATEGSLGASRRRRDRVYSDGIRPELWLNLAGRQPGGIVAPEKVAELHGLLSDMFSRLTNSRGERLVDHLWAREECYRGPFVDLSPDFVVRWNYEAEWDELQMDGRPEPDLQPGANPSPHGNTGDHIPEGILVVRGAAMPAGRRSEIAPITAVADLVLQEAGILTAHG